MSTERPELLAPQPYATATASGARRWVYPRRAPGPLFRWRMVLAIGLLILYTSLPHFTVNGLPAVLLDIPNRHFIILSKEFWATDTLLLALFGIGLVVSIIAITAIFGRVWCGWACPQTVYLEFVFRPIEQLLEGQGETQRKFDLQPWNGSKIARKGIKWLLYLAIALGLAHTFLAYFVGTATLAEWMLRSPLLHPFPFFLVAGMTGLILFDFTWFREQMCTIACPYGRIQGALMDTHSLRVAYDVARGEPRGKGLAKSDGVSPANRGHCVDCKMCVQACPTGIDIRHGLQLECVGCTQCIDACNAVMAKINRPLGLIRHSTAVPAEANFPSLIRPRIVLYALVLLTVGSALGTSLNNREEVLITVLRATDVPYQELPDGSISNHLRIKVTNRTPLERSYTVKLLAPVQGSVTVPVSPLKVPPRGMNATDVFVLLPAAILRDGLVPIEFQIIDHEGNVDVAEFQFIGPQHKGNAP